MGFRCPLQRELRIFLGPCIDVLRIERDVGSKTDDTEMVGTVAAVTANACVLALYKLYSKYGDGLGGNIDGVDGSLSPASLTRAFGLLGVDKDTVAADLGAGAGRPVLAAALLGACKAVGIELPVNVGQEMIFKTVRSRLEELPGAVTGLAARCELTMADIGDLAEGAGSGSPQPVAIRVVTGAPKMAPRRAEFLIFNYFLIHFKFILN